MNRCILGLIGYHIVYELRKLNLEGAPKHLRHLSIFKERSSTSEFCVIAYFFILIFLLWLLSMQGFFQRINMSYVCDFNIHALEHYCHYSLYITNILKVLSFIEFLFVVVDGIPSNFLGVYQRPHGCFVTYM